MMSRRRTPNRDDKGFPIKLIPSITKQSNSNSFN